MSKARQPTDLLILKGKKHLTKAEIQERKSKEVIAKNDNVKAPEYLPESLKKKFDEIAQQLLDINIMSNLDCEALARFIVSEYNYQKVTKKLIRMSVDNDKYLDCLSIQEKLFKMCRQSASDLGLTISSRCKLVVPKPQEQKPQNKFSKFI